jgi:hypothetical protein
MMVGSNVWSQIGSGDSTSESGDTLCSHCHLYMSNISISESTALSHASGNAFVTLNLMSPRLCYMIHCRFDNQW